MIDITKKMKNSGVEEEEEMDLGETNNRTNREGEKERRGEKYLIKEMKMV